MTNNTPSGVKKQGTSNQPLKNYMASLQHHFFTCMHPHKSLSNQT